MVRYAMLVVMRLEPGAVLWEMDDDGCRWGGLDGGGWGKR